MRHEILVWRRWAVAYAVVAAVALVMLLFVVACGPVPTPHPPVDHTAAWTITCRTVVQEIRQREATEAEALACVAVARRGGQVEDLRAWANALPPEPEPDVPPPPVLAPLAADGRIFTQAGQPWRWKGVTAFGQLDRFARGKDIGGFLSDFKGFNLLRVFCYVDWRTPQGVVIGWDAPSPDTVIAFAARVAQDGFYVELVLLTDDNPARIEPARQLVEALKAARPPNVVFEIGNEPTTHKSINTRALKTTLDASGFLYSSGNYENSNLFFGSYLTAHTRRTRDWPRRAHDLLEFWVGGGPNDPNDPAHKVPAVADEPGKIADGGRDPRDWLAYFGASSLMGAGATYHAENTKYSHHRVIDNQIVETDGRPDAGERTFAAVALQGLNAFPADAPRGNYRRIVEPGQSNDARTYVIGSYMVRCQQIGTTAPESGWTALDTDGILFTR